MPLAVSLPIGIKIKSVLAHGALFFVIVTIMSFKCKLFIEILDPGYLIFLDVFKL